MNRNILILSACLLILYAVVMRFLPHPPNMTPIVAIAFAGSLYLGRKWAVVLPLLALFLSDVLIGFYDWKVMLSVYGSFVVIGIVSVIAARYRTVLATGLSVIGSSILFFLVTNAAVWAFSPWYAKTISGLLYSYELGLPFFRNMLIGDLVHTTALIIAFESIITFNILMQTLAKKRRTMQHA